MDARHRCALMTASLCVSSTRVEETRVITAPGTNKRGINLLVPLCKENFKCIARCSQPCTLATDLSFKQHSIGVAKWRHPLTIPYSMYAPLTYDQGRSIQMHSHMHIHMCRSTIISSMMCARSMDPTQTRWLSPSSTTHTTSSVSISSSQIACCRRTRSSTGAVCLYLLIRVCEHTAA